MKTTCVTLALAPAAANPCPDIASPPVRHTVYGDGAVVTPAALVDDTAAAGPEHEHLEEWIMAEVDAGVALPGLYPPDDEHRARYEASRRG